MEAIPQKNKWQIRHLDVVSEPMTEAQLRTELAQISVDQAWVRQGESQWVQAATIVAKLEELERSGVYLRSRDDQEGKTLVGPFTPTRAYQLLSKKKHEKLQAKIGRDAAWRPAGEVLKHFESILAKVSAAKVVQAKAEQIRAAETAKAANTEKPTVAAEKSDSAKQRDSATRPARQTPSATKNKPAEVKRLQACPSCGSQVNVSSFANGTTIACGWCSQQFQVGQAAAPHIQTAVAVPDPVFDTAELPTPAQSSQHRALPSAVPANPYSAPHGNKGYQPRRRQDYTSVKYIVPGVFISLWGAFILIVLLLRVAVVIHLVVELGMDFVDPMKIAKAFAGVFILGGVAIAILTGGINMIRRQGLSQARKIAIAVAIPCVGFFAFPFGIWACVVLFSDQAKRDFREERW